MKAKKKPHGIKQKIREQKEKEKRILSSIFLAAVLIITISISGLIANSMLNQPSANTSSQLKAAIVDHLSLTMPNQTFIQTATNTLNQSGYSVDYYPSEQVTVELYRNLPTHGYKIVILRVHSAVTKGSESLGLFTSERYDKTKYVNEQLTDRLVAATYSEEEREKGIIYFGIGPKFVTQSMKGGFDDSAIIMMGCEGLTYAAMGEAFRQKGAKVYISWSGPVLASYTDQATTRLLQHLILDKQTIGQAVDNTIEEVGADPEYESVLGYYPSIVGNQTIPTLTEH